MIRISLRSWTYTGVMMKGASMHRGITHIARHSLPPRPLMLSAIRSASTSRLPHTLWTPEQEFRPKHKDPFIVKIGQQIEATRDLSKKIAGKAFNTKSLILLCSTFFSVYFIGMYEAWLQVAEAASTSDSIMFMLRYAWDQSVTSVIWNSKPPELSALALGFEPDEILRKFEESVQDAKVQLIIMELETARSVIAGYLCLGQLLTVVNISLDAAKEKAEHINLGMLTPYPGIPEIVVRLAGKESATTNFSMRRMGQHLLPIFEIEEKVERLVRKYSSDGRIPVYWHIGKKYYGSRESYRRLEITSEWLLRSQSDGGPMFYMEADITNNDSSFRIGVESDDLTIEDASQAFGMLNQRAKDCIIHEHFKPFRVVLGDIHQSIYRGSGKPFNLRQRVSERNEADVVIGSKAPIFREILAWCRGLGVDRPAIVFETDDKEHFQNAKNLMFAFGYSLYDSDVDMEKFHAEQRKRSPEEQEDAIPPKPMPRLIYYKTSAASINAAYTLCNNNIIDPTSSCVLLEKAAGMDVLQPIVERSDGKFKIVCIPEIYDDLFRQVRVWARLGYTGQQIQKELDGRFEKIDDYIEAKKQDIIWSC